MPAIEVTETGTKTMPMPRPDRRAGREAGRWRSARELVAVESRTAAAAVISSPVVAMPRGDTWLEQVAGHHGADGDGEGERQEGEPGLQGGVAEDRLQEDRGQEDGADQDAGDAEHHGGAGDEGLELPHVRGEQRLGSRAARA